MTRLVEAASPTSSITSTAAPGAVQTWHMVGAAVRGASHERLDLPCQDAQAYRLLPGGILLVALADGAGSAQFSDQGAQTAVDEALSVLALSLGDRLPTDATAWETILRDAFAAAREAVLCLPDSASEDNPASARDYACTLTCVIAAADILVVGQIGDGAVIAADETGLLFAVTHLQRGEYANETHFLTQADALDQLEVQMVERSIRGLAVMSDGLIRLALKMPAQTPHVPFFQPLFRFAISVEDEAAASQQLAGFLASERVNARTDDDKSLVLAVRIGSSLDQLEPEPSSIPEGSDIHRKSLESTHAEMGTINPTSSEETFSSLEDETTLAESAASNEETGSVEKPIEMDQEGE